MFGILNVVPQAGQQYSYDLMEQSRMKAYTCSKNRKVIGKHLERKMAPLIVSCSRSFFCCRCFGGCVCVWGISTIRERERDYYLSKG